MITNNGIQISKNDNGYFLIGFIDSSLSHEITVDKVDMQEYLKYNKMKMKDIGLGDLFNLENTGQFYLNEKIGIYCEKHDIEWDELSDKEQESLLKKNLVSL